MFDIPRTCRRDTQPKEHTGGLVLAQLLFAYRDLGLAIREQHPATHT
jgi:hypothetical protein